MVMIKNLTEDHRILILGMFADVNTLPIFNLGKVHDQNSMDHR